jgi:hypothetical protein
VAQRISATVTLAACSGVLVALATPGEPAGYRTGLAIGLAITLGLVLLATAASAADRATAGPGGTRVTARPR